jgi:hypothetical protein
MINEEQLKDLTMSDLVTYYNANQALLQHYKNEEVANQCYMRTNESEKYYGPQKKVMRLAKVDARIIKELEKRLLD